MRWARCDEHGMHRGMRREMRRTSAVQRNAGAAGWAFLGRAAGGNEICRLLKTNPSSRQWRRVGSAAPIEGSRRRPRQRSGQQLEARQRDRLRARCVINSSTAALHSVHIAIVPSSETSRPRGLSRNHSLVSTPPSDSPAAAPATPSARQEAPAPVLSSVSNLLEYPLAPPKKIVGTIGTPRPQSQHPLRAGLSVCAYSSPAPRSRRPIGRRQKRSRGEKKRRPLRLSTTKFASTTETGSILSPIRRPTGSYRPPLQHGPSNLENQASSGHPRGSGVRLAASSDPRACCIDGGIGSVEDVGPPPSTATAAATTTTTTATS